MSGEPSGLVGKVYLRTKNLSSSGKRSSHPSMISNFLYARRAAQLDLILALPHESPLEGSRLAYSPTC
jgi:hypothetical protein